ncbi:PIF1 [Mytilus coruscus]|uniref:ATP-dependent DNA helicase n=1 Tax=Mytilus coruscus TaxID=42192 RepID=A0A6J8BJ25_MYTCO|nr:PIF1 [Mytilus coruscus]
MERQIIHELKSLKKVAVTSTTGVASYQLGVGATTLHHWSGVKDGRMTTDELKQTFASDEQFHDARQRILSTETLIIDEVGMLSQLMFEKVELVCRIVKNPHLYFGGLQVIASGDFKQLPPVPNYRYSDTGEYSFSSEAFSTMFPHHFNIKMVVRQYEQKLVEAVNQLCNGSPSAETEEFLKSLDRPLPNVNEHDDHNIKYLFGTNFNTEYMNIEKLEENIQGAATYFKSVDSGKTSLLRDCGEWRILTLKVSAPVMLIRNLSQGLYNGCIGKVFSIDEDKVVVNFEGRLVEVQRTTFEVYDPSAKKVLATRVQLPLRLAYAMTVHRAQGQSLPLVEVDCYSFFSPGQMGVAIGRAMTIQGLRVVNYNSKAAKLKHNEYVYNFYDQES